MIDPKETNPLYDLFAPAWKANRDFAEMHEHILRQGDYLERMGKGTSIQEPSGQFNWRKAASFAMDYCADLVDLRVGNLFLSAPQRSYDDSPYKAFIDEFLADVDGAGTSMDEFMRKAVREQYVNGVDIIIDKTAAPEGTQPRTLADEQTLGIRPVAMLRGPLERVDWSADHAGRYLWVRYSLGCEPRKGEADAYGAERFLTLTPNGWTLYRVSEEGEVQAVEGQTNPAELPVVPFYYTESANPNYSKIPLGCLTRVTPVAKAMLNLLSQGQLDLYMAIGILTVTGVDADKLPTEIGPMCWVALPEGATTGQIAPQVAHVAEKREWLALMTSTMLRMGKVTGWSGADNRASSGFQVVAERTDLDNEMKSTAARCEYVEREVVRLAVQRREGKPVAPEALGYSVEYNRKFVLSGLDDILKQAQAFLDLNVQEQVPGLAQAMTRRVLDQVMRPTDPRYAEIAQQIADAQWDIAVSPAPFAPQAPTDGMQ
jgi:hypothetical protein